MPFQEKSEHYNSHRVIEKLISILLNSNLYLLRPLKHHHMEIQNYTDTGGNTTEDIEEIYSVVNDLNDQLVIITSMK